MACQSTRRTSTVQYVEGRAGNLDRQSKNIISVWQWQPWTLSTLSVAAQDTQRGQSIRRSFFVTTRRSTTVVPPENCWSKTYNFSFILVVSFKVARHSLDITTLSAMLLKNILKLENECYVSWLVIDMKMSYCLTPILVPIGAL